MHSDQGRFGGFGSNFIPLYPATFDAYGEVNF